MMMTEAPFRLHWLSGEEFMMTKTKPCWPSVRGPLAQHAGGFRAELARLGYTPLTAAGQLRLVAHLSRWLAAEGLEASALTAPVVERYFAGRRSAGYANERTVAAAGPLLGYLRGLGAAPVAVATSPATATGQLLARYASYLATERGLAQTTVALNVHLVRPFLLQRAQQRDGRLDLDQLTAAEVRAFVVAQSRQRPRSVKRIVSALRSLLGFLHVDGIIGGPLAGAVPSPAGWTLTGLPKALEAGQVAAMLASCDLGSATGRRDRAILLLLARMGLRAGEAARLLGQFISYLEARGTSTVTTSDALAWATPPAGASPAGRRSGSAWSAASPPTCTASTRRCRSPRPG